MFVLYESLTEEVFIMLAENEIPDDVFMMGSWLENSYDESESEFNDDLDDDSLNDFEDDELMDDDFEEVDDDGYEDDLDLPEDDLGFSDAEDFG
jgi:hypothetical protein